MVLAFPVAGTAAPIQRGATGLAAVHHDTSPPLRSITPKAISAARHVIPVRPLPSRPAGGVTAGVIQRSVGPRAIPSTTLNFDGVGNGFSGPGGTFSVNSAPSDQNAAVGPNHIVDIVNAGFAIFNKSGTAVYGPVERVRRWLRDEQRRRRHGVV
jgi:hypothetical protein